MFDDKEMQAWELKPSINKTWDTTKTHFVTLYKSKEKFNAEREARTGNYKVPTPSSAPTASAPPHSEPSHPLTINQSLSTPTVSKPPLNTHKNMPPHSPPHTIIAFNNLKSNNRNSSPKQPSSWPYSQPTSKLQEPTPTPTVPNIEYHQQHA